MRILFITTGLLLGGAERQTVALADRLADRGHDVAIAYLTGRAEVLPRNPNVRLHAVGCRKTVRGMMSGCWRLRSLIRQFSPDIVHSHMVHANLIARLLRIVTPMPRLICTAHSTHEGGKLVILAYRLTDFLATVSTNVSREAVSAFEQRGAVPKGRMIAVFNGVDLCEFSCEGGLRDDSRQRLFPYPEKRLVLCVGRLAPEKNYSLMLRAFSSVVKTMPNVELWIAGGGNLLPTLKRLRADLLLDDSVCFLGPRSDVPDLMRAADVFALSSVFEGFGLVVAEAMACGTITVATDAGGIGEVINGLGYCVPVGNQAALELALISALQLPSDKARELVDAGRRHIEHNFNIDHTVDRWLDVYRGVYSC